MARKRGGSGAKNGRDSNPKYLGVKASGGTFVKAGTIIARQRGTKIHPGTNVGCGRDYTLFAKATGTVVFLNRRGRKLASVVPVEGTETVTAPVAEAVVAAVPATETAVAVEAAAAPAVETEPVAESAV